MDIAHSQLCRQNFVYDGKKMIGSGNFGELSVPMKVYKGNHAIAREYVHCQYRRNLNLAERIDHDPAVFNDPDVRAYVRYLVLEKARGLRDRQIEDLCALLRDLHLFECDASAEANADLIEEIVALCARVRHCFIVNPSLRAEGEDLLCAARQMLERTHPMRGEFRPEVGRLTIEELMDLDMIHRLTC